VDAIGGTVARIPIVRWRDATGAPHEERTDAPGALVARLAAEAGGEPRDLEVIRPSLEDIYLALVREADERAGTEVAA
jgi:ABC-2 type transport system ATP-binding protein